MNWVQRKIYLYNVTFGLYMLDWWERYLFNSLVLILMWFILYNGSRYFSELCKRGLLEFALSYAFNSLNTEQSDFKQILWGFELRLCVKYAQKKHLKSLS
ncbi:unnamed protein product [Arabidopsis thaliana]|uniref:Uncharacterized protein n=1 Tax=Arabidopsis thaliana TaxID=3702 RepID=A0A654EXP1_ARATH|nr:unnamed protein product [Arabidopsis thaliana]VYS54044.1 unnamed protein product [Arabidopsis thaliana]